VSNEVVLVPQSADPAKWSLEQSALLEFAGLVKTVNGQKVYAPVGVTQAFIQAVQRSGLDPFARQIYASEIGGKWTILGAIDGFRAVAASSHEYEGRTPIQYTADGVQWTDTWLLETPPAAARVGVKRKGYDDYAFTVVTWKEFGRTTGQWRTQPAHMLGIRVLSHALRDAFPQLLGGIYTPEDFDHQADAIVIEPSEDWGTLIEVATTKDELSVIAERARNRNEYTDDVRVKVLARYGAINRGEITTNDEPEEES
jgi:hypothetical protein